jgi:hypothetical protein
MLEKAIIYIFAISLLPWSVIAIERWIAFMGISEQLQKGRDN